MTRRPLLQRLAALWLDMDWTAFLWGFGLWDLPPPAPDPDDKAKPAQKGGLGPTGRG
jgi:hypothetical protein